MAYNLNTVTTPAEHNNVLKAVDEKIRSKELDADVPGTWAPNKIVFTDASGKIRTGSISIDDFSNLVLPQGENLEQVLSNKADKDLVYGMIQEYKSYRIRVGLTYAAFNFNAANATTQWVRVETLLTPMLVPSQILINLRSGTDGLNILANANQDNWFNFKLRRSLTDGSIGTDDTHNYGSTAITTTFVNGSRFITASNINLNLIMPENRYIWIGVTPSRNWNTIRCASYTGTSAPQMIYLYQPASIWAQNPTRAMWLSIDIYDYYALASLPASITAGGVPVTLPGSFTNPLPLNEAPPANPN